MVDTFFSFPSKLFLLFQMGCASFFYVFLMFSHPRLPRPLAGPKQPLKKSKAVFLARFAQLCLGIIHERLALLNNSKEFLKIYPGSMLRNLKS